MNFWAKNHANCFIAREVLVKKIKSRLTGFFFSCIKCKFVMAIFLKKKFPTRCDILFPVFYIAWPYYLGPLGLYSSIIQFCECDFFSEIDLWQFSNWDFRGWVHTLTRLAFSHTCYSGTFAKDQKIKQSVTKEL